jgi:hypothetical protein
MAAAIIKKICFIVSFYKNPGKDILFGKLFKFGSGELGVGSWEWGVGSGEWGTDRRELTNTAEG